MTIHDISVPLRNGMPFFPGDPAPQITRLADHARGDAWTVTHLSFSAHIGTHVDAPLHRIWDGAPVDALDLHTLIGPAYVADLTSLPTEIAAVDLEAAAIPQDTVRLLLKTRNGALWQREGFQADYVALTDDAADWLIERGIRLVAVDYLSADLDRAQEFPVHTKLLGAGIAIVEGVLLDAVTAGRYILVCLPLRVQDADGAPARAVLVSGTNWFSEEEK